MILARQRQGRPAVVTTAPGPLVMRLVRLSAWLDAHGPVSTRSAQRALPGSIELNSQPLLRVAGQLLAQLRKVAQ